ncbi:Zn(II)2Cys6 transcription factor [Aspergillus sclerotioniger CBS 115572]|uniref:Zn(II)2Cys6 transcription factor n=1 Tax=Aspergillus sclerotioniger CBS 115572 TaxID=1450535 RepID=A0A317VZK8_9EURO|nr:Zn(II)2Cys6 transcription factor [Aspergillus sclerotioniger CBS 115572]PWY77330.1 Zn(II)2Cys6 transcription factor [Aspergillus sclerotioniger CBS 115572]
MRPVQRYGLDDQRHFRLLTAPTQAKHVQCTEELPICQLCKRHGWPCERGLRVVFQDDAAQRGVGFGRHGTLTSQPQLWQEDSEFRSVPLNAYVGRWIFVNTVSSNFTEVAGNMDGVSTGDEGSDILSEAEELDDKLPMDPCLAHPLTVYPDSESYLLEFFIHGIGPNCALTTINNPYISLITPLAFCDTTLRNAVISVAANQLRLLGDSRFSHQALVYKNKALKGLQQAISLGNIDDGTIATVLMLCFHAISHESDPSWVTHLQGGLDLISSVPCNATTGDSLRKFFEMYFVAHAIMSRTASPGKRCVKGKYTWSDNDNLDEIDTIMGCSRRLMGLINDISDLPLNVGHAVREVDTSDEETEDRPIDSNISRASKIACSLSTITQTLPDHSKDRDDLSQIAETKRLAALIYLIGRVNDADMIIDEGTTKFSLVSMLINIISTLPDTPTLLWPLYILGHSGLEDEDHRRFVLDRLERMQRIRNLGSVRRARVAVKHAFQVFDMRLSTARVKNAEAFSSISLA